MPKRGTNDPTTVITTREAAIVIGQVNKTVLFKRPTKDVAVFGGVMAPTIAGVAGYATMRRTINVITLKAISIRCGNVPPRVLKLAIVIGKVNCAI